MDVKIEINEERARKFELFCQDESNISYILQYLKGLKNGEVHFIVKNYKIVHKRKISED